METIHEQDPPWHRTRTVSTAAANDNSDSGNQGRQLFQNVMKSTEASVQRMVTDIEQMFTDREVMLEQIILEGRFHTIEHFLTLEFERQREELMRVFTTAIISTTAEQDDEYSTLTQRIKILWYARALEKYEQFFNKVRVIRSAFLRTFEFFRMVTEMTLEKLQEKHVREMTMLKARHLMILQADTPFSTSSQHLEITQTRERQCLEVANIREMNDRTSAREIAMLEFHLSCNEEIVHADLEMWKKIAQMKIDNTSVISETEILHRRQTYDNSISEKRCHDEEIERLQKHLTREATSTAAGTRDQKRKERYNEFFVKGKSVANESLYKLTFATRERMSEVLIDSDDESDVEDNMSEAIDTEIHSSVLALRRRQKKQSHAIRRSIKKQSEAKIAAMRQSQRQQRREALDVLHNNVESIYRAHIDKHSLMATTWSKEQSELREQHSTSISLLIEKQKEDTKILLQADLKRDATTKSEGNATAQKNMSYHVFHEMRNVLCSLLAIAESFAYCDELELHELALKQRVICDYAVETMNTMLDITSYQGGIYTLRLSPVSIRDLFAHVIQVQGSRVAKGVELLQAAPDTVVCMDQHVVTQLMVNLLSNSAKYTERGFVKLVAKVQKAAEQGQWAVEIGVVDSGVGIAAQQQQANEYLVRNTGYGHYLINLIAKSVAGTFTVLSPVPKEHWTIDGLHSAGPGSYCCVAFQTTRPISTVGAAAVEATAVKAITFNPSGAIRVLIADDQALVRIHLLHLMVHLIEKYPTALLTVSTVKSAEEAMRCTSTESFDLLFIDQNYDQTQLQQSVGQKCMTGKRSQCVLDNHVLGAAQEAVKQFRLEETFDVQPGDGKEKGTDFIQQYTGHGLCIIASGSPFQEENQLSIIKPYTVKALAEAMEYGALNSPLVRSRLSFDKERTVALKDNPTVQIFTT